MVLVVKNPPINAGDLSILGLIPGSGRSSGGQHGNPPVFLPGESHALGASQAIVHRVGHNESNLAHTHTHTTVCLVSPLCLLSHRNVSLTSFEYTSNFLPFSLPDYF